jgi:hypothetical protein
VAKRGLSGIRDAAAEIEARKQAGGSGWTRWLKVQENAEVQVRFLEQGDDVEWCWMHQLPAKEGQSYGDNEPCINTNDDGQACPGCERGLRRVVNGFINVIYRNAPVWEEDAEGKLPRKDGKPVYNKIAEKDQVFVWKGGVTVFEELDGIDATYRGLCSRDFTIKRKGTGLSTKYTIQPVMDSEGNSNMVPMTDADKALEKYDLKQFTTPAPYDEWGQGRARKPAAETDGNGQAPGSGADLNPFMRDR